ASIDIEESTLERSRNLESTRINGLATPSDVASFDALQGEGPSHRHLVTEMENTAVGRSVAKATGPVRVRADDGLHRAIPRVSRVVGRCEGRESRDRPSVLLCIDRPVDLRYAQPPPTGV